MSHERNFWRDHDWLFLRIFKEGRKREFAKSNLGGFLFALLDWWGWGGGRGEA